MEERPRPERRDGEVLIRVEAISVPFYETQLRCGMLPGGEPAVFGHEAVGVVVEADDEQLVGRRVAGMSYVGGVYAEFVAASQYTLVPERVSSENAVGAAVPAAVAIALVRTAKIVDSETVLVEAASESIGGPRAAELVPKLAPRGRILAYGLLSGEFPVLTVADLISRGLTLIGFGGPDAYGKDVAAARGEALRLVADGTLTPVIDRTYALEDVVEAHARVESREGVGKVLLVP
ncbi:zinc-binding dehydrogenase [Amycolatopsis sp. NPDC088138]|uniref:zinc-binding dehydrogenase n=1 Tax=Amycolatopsis sp. NPDC088138 TaxID=3363938 RepID=UPI0038049BD7